MTQEEQDVIVSEVKGVLPGSGVYGKKPTYFRF